MLEGHIDDSYQPLTLRIQRSFFIGGFTDIIYLYKMERLDKSAFKKQSYQEASNNFKYWTSKSRKERLEAAYYLNSVAYNFPIDDPPRMDKSIFKARKRN